jgi:hypothetical protein
MFKSGGENAVEDACAEAGGWITGAAVSAAVSSGTLVDVLPEAVDAAEVCSGAEVVGPPVPPHAASRQAPQTKVVQSSEIRIRNVMTM